MKRDQVPAAAAAAFAAAFAATSIGCGAKLPADVEGYQTRCTRMNAAPIPPYESDPHRGTKEVFACNVEPGALRANTRPFAAGTMIVKQSTREGESFPWLVATARKMAGGAWQWDEYTRNFSSESLRRIVAPQSVCTGCHRRARDADWIFTVFAAP